MRDLWKRRLETLDFAFQPIVNIHTGATYGFEALLRNWNEAGFDSISHVFDSAFEEEILCDVDFALRDKAIRKFQSAKLQSFAHLFYNLDNRTLESGQCSPARTIQILQEANMSGMLCFEISERHPLSFSQTTLGLLASYRAHGLQIAADDYGAGFSGLQLLYYTEPDFIKIDRFFIQDIGTDPKKKHFVAGLLNNAHLLGSVVVAEGVETTRELHECTAIGCDLVQGYLVQYPEMDTNRLYSSYPHIAELRNSSRRGRNSDRSLLDSELQFIQPVLQDAEVWSVFEKFRQALQHALFPVVNALGEPVGVIRESSFKEFAYSRFGRELLQNRGTNRRLMQFVERIPIADIHSPAERILELFSLDREIEGILLVDSRKYVGFLSARSLLRILHEKNLQTARDQNPLTRLPGNTVIFEYVSSAIEDTKHDYTLVYLDVDRFKPFNDLYGFRRGDRVLLRLAELLRETPGADMVAHIGGDDFFMGFSDELANHIMPSIQTLVRRFAEDAVGFHDVEDQQRGFIIGKDRSGVMTEFPLLTLSAVVLSLPKDRPVVSQDAVSSALASAKLEAKRSAGAHIWSGILHHHQHQTSQYQQQQPAFATAIALAEGEPSQQETNDHVAAPHN